MTATGARAAPARRGGKSRVAFRTISEVADELDVAQHVLRFWETRFHQVRPLKRAGGRRYYRPEDIDLLRCIRSLLYTEGYTIKGVQRLLRQVGVQALLADAEAPGESDESDAESADVGVPPEPDGVRLPIERAIAKLEACRRVLAGVG